MTPRDEEEMQEEKEKSKRGRRQTALGDITKPPPPGRGREWEKAGRRGRGRKSKPGWRQAERSPPTAAALCRASAGAARWPSR